MAHEICRSTNADLSEVKTRDDFAAFLGRVLEDLHASGASEWENGTLDRFLDALAAVAEGRVVDVPVEVQERASWALFADLVVAATGYE